MSFLNLFKNPISSENRFTENDHKSVYDRPESLASYLPYKNYSPDSGTINLSDGLSCGAVLEIEPYDAEAKSVEALETVITNLESVFNIIEEKSPNPWIVQLYKQDSDILKHIEHVEAYMLKNGKADNPTREEFLTKYREHIFQLSSTKKVFKDDATGVDWRAREQCVRMVIFRWSNSDKDSKYTPEQECASLVRSISKSFSRLGLKTTQSTGIDFYKWMFAWFNPKPFGHDNPYEFFSKRNLSEEQFHWNYDLGESVINHTPKTENGNWYFNERPHRYLPILELSNDPVPGRMTIETMQNENKRVASFLDQLPASSVFSMTIVIEPQDKIELELESLIKRTRGRGTPQARSTNDDAVDILDVMQDHKIYPVSMGVFVTAENDKELDEYLKDAYSVLNTDGCTTVQPEYDLVSYSSYIQHLPFCYKPDLDKLVKRQRVQWLKHILAYSPLLGQSQGTRNSGLNFFNRSGEPLGIDPLNPTERNRVAHSLIFGPSGSGKSSTLVYLLLQMMAAHKPHQFIIDVGESFKLLGDYYLSIGLDVKYINLDKQDIKLPPFANSQKMLDQEREPASERSDESDTEKRHILSEMESAAKLLVTGGDQMEIDAFKRHDSSIVRAAIKQAALDAETNGDPHATIDDFVRAFDKFIQGEIPPGYDIAPSKESHKRIEEIRDAARFFTEGERGQIFNGHGKAFEEADVTIIDLGKIGMDESLKDMMSLAVIGLINSIQNQAEIRRTSFGDDARESLLLIDEAHTTTSNPIIADFVTKGSKMWRKWGLWLWMATQNLKDFPDASDKILSMAEFWFCLSMPKKEVADIERFVNLTEEMKSLLMSARKQTGKFVEGVILNVDEESKSSLLFRNVPPAYCFALAQTEKKEVARRRELMKTYELETELEAIIYIEKEIQKGRNANA